jgi:hypothetical protein
MKMYLYQMAEVRGSSCTARSYRFLSESEESDEERRRRNMQKKKEKRKKERKRNNNMKTRSRPCVVHILGADLHLGVLDIEVWILVVDLQRALVNGSRARKLVLTLLPLAVAEPDTHLVPLHA